MTIRTLLKVIDKEDIIEIVDSGLPISENVLFRGKRKNVTKNITKEKYLRFRDKHVSGIIAVDDVICIIADVTIGVRRVMNKCGDCAHYENCKKYVTKDECFFETNGCTAFKCRKEDNNEPSSM